MADESCPGPQRSLHLIPTRSGLRNVIVIGAGVAGLCTARQLLCIGVQVLVLEASPDVGGVWARNYDGYGLQIPWRHYQFPDFLWPKELQPKGTYASGREVFAYIRAYAAHYGLARHVRLNCKLLRLRWCGEARQWEALWCDTAQERFFKARADYTVICSGLYNNPYIPHYKGSECFSGLQLHAKDFTDMSVARGRRVVIVGAGKTALDCVGGLLASRAAAAVTLLYRSAHWPLPRSVAGLPVRRLLFTRAAAAMLPPYYTADGVDKAVHAVVNPLKRLFWRGLECAISRKFKMGSGKMTVPRVGLPSDLFYGGQILDDSGGELMQAENLTAIKGEINQFVSRGVILQDGSFRPADVILYCTGYVKTYEYFEDEMRERLGLQKDGLYLYRNCLPCAVPHLAFIGSEVSTYSNIVTDSLQALWLAHVLMGAVQLPPADVMAADVRAQQRWRREVMPAQRSRGAVLMMYGIKYHDQLLADMGQAPRRKGINLLSECFGAYSPSDYTCLLERIQLTAVRDEQKGQQQQQQQQPQQQLQQLQKQPQQKPSLQAGAGGAAALPQVGLVLSRKTTDNSTSAASSGAVSVGASRPGTLSGELWRGSGPVDSDPCCAAWNFNSGGGGGGTAAAPGARPRPRPWSCRPPVRLMTYTPCASAAAAPDAATASATTCPLPSATSPVCSGLLPGRQPLPLPPQRLSAGPAGASGAGAGVGAAAGVASSGGVLSDDEAGSLSLALLLRSTPSWKALLRSQLSPSGRHARHAGGRAATATATAAAAIPAAVSASRFAYARRATHLGSGGGGGGGGGATTAARGSNSCRLHVCTRASDAIATGTSNYSPWQGASASWLLSSSCGPDHSSSRTLPALEVAGGVRPGVAAGPGAVGSGAIVSNCSSSASTCNRARLLPKHSMPPSQQQQQQQYTAAFESRHAGGLHTLYDSGCVLTPTGGSSSGSRSAADSSSSSSRGNRESTGCNGGRPPPDPQPAPGLVTRMAASSAAAAVAGLRHPNRSASAGLTSASVAASALPSGPGQLVWGGSLRAGALWSGGAACDGLNGQEPQSQLQPDDCLQQQQRCWGREGGRQTETRSPMREGRCDKPGLRPATGKAGTIQASAVAVAPAAAEAGLAATACPASTGDGGADLRGRSGAWQAATSTATGAVSASDVTTPQPDCMIVTGRAGSSAGGAAKDVSPDASIGASAGASPRASLSAWHLHPGVCLGLGLGVAGLGGQQVHSSSAELSRLPSAVFALEEVEISIAAPTESCLAVPLAATSEGGTGGGNGGGGGGNSGGGDGGGGSSPPWLQAGSRQASEVARCGAGAAAAKAAWPAVH